MTDIRIAPVLSGEAVTLDLLLTPSGGLDTSQELATAAIVALGTDRRANPDDILPDPASQDRRGWWGDTDALEIWGGWPIGCRLWLLERAKIVGPGAREGATVARVEEYVREALQPFVDLRVASGLAVHAERTGTGRIDCKVTLYRGPLPAIELRYASIWDEIGA